MLGYHNFLTLNHAGLYGVRALKYPAWIIFLDVLDVDVACDYKINI